MSLSELATTNILNKITTKLGKVIFEGKKIPQLVRIINEPRKYRRTFIKRATTTDTEFQDDETPLIEIQNPLDQDTIIKSISLVPDSTFKTNGQIIVKVDNVTVLDDSAVGDWTDISEFVLDFEGGRKIKARRFVTAFVKTSSGTSAITLVVTFGD